MICEVNMLSVDKINNLEYNNNLLNDTISKIHEELIEGYNTDMPYTAIHNCFKIILELERRYRK